jgi:hypothetical protein
MKYIIQITLIHITCLFIACKPNKIETKDEQIRLMPNDADTNFITDSSNSVNGNLTLKQIPSDPSSVILTGNAEHRLIPIYKIKPAKKSEPEKRSYSFWSNNEGYGEESVAHFMPGIDIHYGFNLLNIAHYNMKTGQLNLLFTKPAFIKTLYYPSLDADSIDKVPVLRDYYLITAYDNDSNKDTLINRKDLRAAYYFDVNGQNKIRLIPENYSVLRSQYDSKNDAMFIYAKCDANKNGMIEKEEPLHIFWIDLKMPTVSKLMY